MATSVQDLAPPAKARRTRQSADDTAKTSPPTTEAVEPATRRRGTMTDDHKAALARGREEGRVVRSYLEALDQNRPHRGRPVTLDSLERRLAAVDGRIAARPAPMIRLNLVQERMDVEREIEAFKATADISDLEAAFVAVARSYGERRGISYFAWRAAGVEARVLKAAGIARTQD